ncbi:MAG: EI24 domain-containing protein [Chloroflexota bacterium]
MSQALPANPVARFSVGLGYPFRALGFLCRHPRLLRFVLLPFLINLTVFTVAVSLGLRFFDQTVLALLPQGEAWYWVLLHYLLWLVAALVTAVLVFFLFAVVGNLLAAPFNDILAARAVEILTGRHEEEPFCWTSLLRDSRRVLADEIRKIGLFLLGMLVLLSLNFLPGLGSLLYAVLSVLWTTFFLVVEYTGYVFGRLRIPFPGQRRFVLGHKALAFGFGLGLLALLAVPFLQFLAIPLGVIGAVQLCYDTGLMAHVS